MEACSSLKPTSVSPHLGNLSESEPKRSQDRSRTVSVPNSGMMLTSLKLSLLRFPGRHVIVAQNTPHACVMPNTIFPSSCHHTHIRKDHLVAAPFHSRNQGHPRELSSAACRARGELLHQGQLRQNLNGIFVGQHIYIWHGVAWRGVARLA